MKYKYRKDMKVNYNFVDQNLKLSLVSSLLLLQEMGTEYFESFKSDNLTVSKENNAVWVVDKTKLHFNKYPAWKDILDAEAYTISSKIAASETETKFKSKNGELFFVAKQKSCPIDISERKIRKINTIRYPEDMETCTSVFDMPYLKLKAPLSLFKEVYSQKVMQCDIDYSKHTNNVMYVRYIINCLDSKFMNEHMITDFEIHHLAESKEGDELKIYMKENEKNEDSEEWKRSRKSENSKIIETKDTQNKNNEIDVIKNNDFEFLIMHDEREIARAYISCKKV